ncbi:apolipoprotein D-like [Hemitrygon akajei]|uniref:apolipoprotein D-like n=1 Tax=Hemitrygon akajei TaxID=2704970 RepID=UPI003BF9C89D
MQGPLLMLVFSIICLPGANSKNGRGKCPEVKLQENFSLTKYMGIWYDIEHLPTHTSSGDCVSEEYILDNDGWVDLRVEEKLKNGSLRVHKGNVIPAHLNVTASLQYQLKLPFKHVPDIAELSFVPYLVLATDYETYSLVYSCFQQIPTAWHHVQYVWILSRERHLAENITDNLHEILKSYDIKTEEMVKTVQEDCPKHVNQ